MTKKKVCVIGLGYVGLPMTVAIANIKKKNKHLYETYGYDNDLNKITNIQNSIKTGKLPIDSLDLTLKRKFSISAKKNKISLITDIKNINIMDVLILSVGFDFINNKNSFKNLTLLIENISSNIKKGALLLVETTLPPGTFEKILIPKIFKSLKKRKMKINDVFLSYSYERVMPGKNYYNSIINNYRCYSGLNRLSKNRVKTFLKTLVNHKKFPLKELNSITECEAAKILENSYRSINIALIDEWVKYADLIKIDLMNVINAIKIRPSHSNIMSPGLGVGGYCLPKDGLFAGKSSKILFKRKINFPFIDLASKVNNDMPLTAIKLIENKVNKIRNKKILIMGTAYKEDVDDERNSPSKFLIKKLKSKGSKITIYDPMIKKNKVPKFNKYDLVLFCVNHRQFKNIPLKNYSKKPVYFDLNNVIDRKKAKFMKNNSYKIFILGKYYG